MIIKTLCRLITWLILQIPDEKDIGDELLALCLLIVSRAVKMTSTRADDDLYEAVAEGLKQKNID